MSGGATDRGDLVNGGDRLVAVLAELECEASADIEQCGSTQWQSPR